LTKRRSILSKSKNSLRITLNTLTSLRMMTSARRPKSTLSSGKISLNPLPSPCLRKIRKELEQPREEPKEER
jgi:hypothetical protein